MVCTTEGGWSEDVFLFVGEGLEKDGRFLSRSTYLRIIQHEGSKFKGGVGKTVINWGAGSFPYLLNRGRILNKPEAVVNATNKRRFLELCREAGSVAIPNFTTRRAEARDWVGSGLLLFGRTKLTGSGGEGIVECGTTESIDTLPEGTLFVEYVKKKYEYRIHVAGGKVIFTQEKLKTGKTPLEITGYHLRSEANGFEWGPPTSKPTVQVERAAVSAIQVCGLDFGAVDVVWNKMRGLACVLKVNPAPNLDTDAIVPYREYFTNGSSSTFDKYDARTIQETMEVR